MASFNSINKVMLMGRLGKDPELRASQSGLSIARFSVATSERIKSQDGNFTDKTEWHNIIVFGNQAENCSRFIKKGSLVFIEGKIQSRSYTDKNGIEKYITEVKADSIHFLDSKEASGNESSRVYSSNNQSNKLQKNEFNKAVADVYNSENIDDDDDLPF